MDISTWVSAGQTSLLTTITSAGPWIMGLMGIIAGIGLIMTIIQRVTGGR